MAIEKKAGSSEQVPIPFILSTLTYSHLNALPSLHLGFGGPERPGHPAWIFDEPLVPLGHSLICAALVFPSWAASGGLEAGGRSHPNLLMPQMPPNPT